MLPMAHLVVEAIERYKRVNRDTQQRVLYGPLLFDASIQESKVGLSIWGSVIGLLSGLASVVLGHEGSVVPAIVAATVSAGGIGTAAIDRVAGVVAGTGAALSTPFRRGR